MTVTFPVFFTSYVHVTVDPTATTGPGALSASCPFVFFSRESPGACVAVIVSSPCPVTFGPVGGVPVPVATLYTLPASRSDWLIA